MALKNFQAPKLDERIHTMLSIHPEGLSLPELAHRLRSEYEYPEVEDGLRGMVRKGEVRVTNKVFWLTRSPQTIRLHKAG